MNLLVREELIQKAKKKGIKIISVSDDYVYFVFNRALRFETLENLKRLLESL